MTVFAQIIATITSRLAGVAGPPFAATVERPHGTTPRAYAPGTVVPFLEIVSRNDSVTECAGFVVWNMTVEVVAFIAQPEDDPRPYDETALEAAAALNAAIAPANGIPGADWIQLDRIALLPLAPGERAGVRLTYTIGVLTSEDDLNQGRTP